MKKLLNVFYFKCSSNEIMEYDNLLSEHELNTIIFPVEISDQLEFNNSKVRISAKYYNARPISAEEIDKQLPEEDIDYMVIMPKNDIFLHYIEPLQNFIIRNSHIKFYIMNESENFRYEDKENIISLNPIYEHKSLYQSFKKQYNATTILLYSLSANSNSLDTHILLADKLSKAGHKLLNIGNHPISELFDFHTFPDSIYDNISVLDKIEIVNDFIEKLVEKNQPNVILISVPGFILPIVNTMSYTNEDETPYVISKSIQPDFCILNMLINNAQYDLFSSNINYFAGKIECDIDCICVSKNLYDVLKSKEHNKAVFYEINDRTIDEIIKTNQSINYLYKYNDVNRIYDLLMSKLAIDSNIIRINFNAIHQGG